MPPWECSKSEVIRPQAVERDTFLAPADMPQEVFYLLQ